MCVVNIIPNLTDAVKKNRRRRGPRETGVLLFVVSGGGATRRSARPDGINDLSGRKHSRAVRL